MSGSMEYSMSVRNESDILPEYTSCIVFEQLEST